MRWGDNLGYLDLSCVNLATLELRFPESPSPPSPGWIGAAFPFWVFGLTWGRRQHHTCFCAGAGRKAVLRCGALIPALQPARTLKLRFLFSPRLLTCKTGAWGRDSERARVSLLLTRSLIASRPHLNPVTSRRPISMTLWPRASKDGFWGTWSVCNRFREKTSHVTCGFKCVRETM